MVYRFTARLRGNEPHEAGYIEVPPLVMRNLGWGRYVRVTATINEKHDVPTTIMNVGWGPSFLVSQSAIKAAGVDMNEPVSVVVRLRK